MSHVNQINEKLRWTAKNLTSQLGKMKAVIWISALCLMSGSLFSQNQSSPTAIQSKGTAKPSSIQVISLNPVVFPVAGRQVDIQMKVSAPATGKNLPIIILSHGHGSSNYLSSLRGLAPLTEFFTTRGFVVVQPTHLDSKTLGLDPNGPEGPTFWRSRAKDMDFILDNLHQIMSSLPGLAKRVNKTQVSAIGHSLGGLTVAMLAGMEMTDQVTGEKVNAAEPRLKARVMIGVPGSPDGITGKFAKDNYPFLRGINFGTMTLPALVVYGDKDKNPNFSNLDKWRADAYYDSPGPNCLLTVYGAEHIYGGISGYDVAETTDESPERVAFICEIIHKYIRSALNPKDASWEDAKKSLNGVAGAKGRIDSK